MTFSNEGVAVIQRSIKFLGRLTYLILNHLTFGLFDIVVTAVQEFSRLEASAAAASIAYYALFSLFPLLLVLLSVLSFFLQEEQAQVEVIRLVREFFPIIDEDTVQLVEENLHELISQRNSMSILGMIGLLWGGSNVFAVLAKNINQAWHIVADPLGFLQMRLVAFGIISILAALWLLSFIPTIILDSPIILNLVSRFSMPLWGTIAVYVTPLGVGVANLLPYVFSFFLFFALYRWVPNTQVRWLEATGGALVATLAWRWAIVGFTWVISQGLVNYQVIYGSLATVVLAMFWIYFSSIIILFGAHFSAAIARHKRPTEALNLDE